MLVLVLLHLSLLGSLLLLLTSVSMSASLADAGKPCEERCFFFSFRGKI